MCRDSPVVKHASSVYLHLFPLPPYSHHTSHLPYNVPRFPVISLPSCRLSIQSACEKLKVGTLLLSRVCAF